MRWKELHGTKTRGSRLENRKGAQAGARNALQMGCCFGLEGEGIGESLGWESPSRLG